MGYPDTPWQQGDILKSEELNAMVPGLSPIGTIIPWALPFAETGGSVYSNVARFAPFHLPATGGVYANSVAPLLAGAVGHTFVDGEPDVGADGDLISGAALNKHHGTGYDNGAIYRRDGDNGPAVLVLADAFCTPDMRGRSPIGANPNITTEYYGPDSGPTTVNIERGMRVGDWRVHDHDHRIQSTTLPSNFVVGHSTNRQDGTGLHTIEWNGNPGADTSRPLYAKTLPTDPAYGSWPGYPLEGQGSNLSPATGVHFLIFAGERISDPTPVTGTGGARSGEPVRMHPVTTASMIRKRLTDPNLSDDEREYLTALLNGEPWPPNDPPATRTATKTTRKTTTRKRKKS